MIYIYIYIKEDPLWYQPNILTGQMFLYQNWARNIEHFLQVGGVECVFEVLDKVRLFCIGMGII